MRHSSANPLRLLADARRFAFVLGLFAMSTLHATGATPEHRVIGYVVDGEQAPRISAGKLDVVNFAFALVKADGTIYLPSATAASSLASLTALRKEDPQLKILLSIGGWGADHFSEAAATAAGRACFADSAAVLVRKHDLDGVDIDWEYPTLPGPGISHSPEDRENFSLLLETTRARLDALGRAEDRGYLLTIAAADGEAARGLDIPRIAPVLDWINLMTYDFYGSLTPTTGHHTGLHRTPSATADGRATDMAVAEFLTAGTPPRKLNIGVAFYGRRFDGVKPENNGLNQPYDHDGGFVPWRELSSGYIGQQGFVHHWDEQAQAPYLWNPESRAFITYDDPRSLRAKAVFVRENGLGGVMYWEHRLDAEEHLLDALREGLRRDPDGAESP